jgi:Flp pilus assembly protein TadD
LKLKEYDNAISDLTEVIRLQPNNAEAYHRRGLAFPSLRRNESAISNYKSQLKFAENEKSREDAKNYLRELRVVE